MDTISWPKEIRIWRRTWPCIHLAAVADLYEAESDHSKCYSINIDGAKIVGKACSKHSTRLLFVSQFVRTEITVFWFKMRTPLGSPEVYANQRWLLNRGWRKLMDWIWELYARQHFMDRKGFSLAVQFLSIVSWMVKKYRFTALESKPGVTLM